jgi:Ca2+-binding RTX toxin-like protein
MRRVALVLGAMALALLMASGVAWAVTKIGTDGPDTLRGTNGNDTLIGKGGNDILFALNGRDNLLGGPGNDWVDTHPTGFRSGDKNLVGGRGNDAVIGGRGADNVLGGDGNDLVADGPFREFATDRLTAGAGNDVVAVINKPAFKDIVTCGEGFDRVLADRKDVLADDCERVFIGVGSFDEFFASIPQSFFEGLHPEFVELLLG